MCLAVPAQVVEFDTDTTPDEAVVDLHGNRVRVNTLMTPGVRIGDWVLVHVGFAMSIIDEQEAADTLKFLQELGEAYEEEMEMLASSQIE